MEILRFTRRELSFIIAGTCLMFLFSQIIIQWGSINENGPDGEETSTAFDPSVKVQVSPSEDLSQGIPQRSDMLKQLSDMDTSDVPYGYDFDVDRIERGIENPLKHTITNALPIILWWTPFTGEMGSVKKCSLGQCFFSQNRTLFYDNRTQVMLFYGTSFNESDLPLPRQDHHEWAVLHEESPKNNALFYHEDFISLFNHTSTFKQQSDYPITTQYVNSLEELQKRPVLSFHEKDQLDVSSTIFLQSGCNPPSDRDAYVRELMKYMKVDSYGECLRNKELPLHLKSPLTMHDDSLRDFVGKYKFALTFENAICDDYITEKLWRPLAAGVIPVYKGAPNIQEWLPDNKSVILIDDFKSAKELANYLNYVAKNESEYFKYLNFKRNGVKNEKLLNRIRNREWGINDFYKMSFITGFECFICDRLHQNRMHVKEKGEPIHHIANNQHYGCPRPNMYSLQSPPKTEDWERETWQLEYDDAKYRATKLRELISKRLN